MPTSTTPGNLVQEVYGCWRRHKWKSLVLWVVVFSSIAVVGVLTPKAYRSEAKLFVRLGRENATLDPTATLGSNPIVAVPQSRENEINSVVEILQTRALLEKVVDALGPAAVLGSKDQGDASSEPSGWMAWAGGALKQGIANAKGFVAQFGASAGLDDREKAVLQLQRRLSVAAAKKSNVVEISCEGSTPGHCQTIVAKLIDMYLDEHLRLNRAHGSQQFFDQQTHRLRESLAAKEAQLRDLKNRTGLASPDAQRALIVARIGRLEDELLQAETAQAVAEAKVAQLRSKRESLPEKQVVNETAGFGNEGTDRMRDQFFALQVREKEAAAKYTAEHPRLQQLRQQVAEARALLESEESGRKQVTTEPNRLRQQTETALLAEEPALASLTAHADQVRKQLAGVREQLSALNENQMQVAALQREVDLLEADYRKYSATLEQARIDQELEAQRMSNIGIVQPASYEPRPIRPRMGMMLLLGFCAATCGALGLPLLIEQIGCWPPQAEPERSAPLPQLAAIPRVPARTAESVRTKVPR